MKVRVLVPGLILTAAAAAALSSTISDCSRIQKAREEASAYLTEEELHIADEHVKTFEPSSQASVSSIDYWDKTRTLYAAQKAYRQGLQAAQDSIQGKRFSKPEYKMPLDTVFDNNSQRPNIKIDSRFRGIDGLDFETIKNLFSNEPSDKLISWKSKYGEKQLHYWNTLTLTGKQREAFQKGINDSK